MNEPPKTESPKPIESDHLARISEHLGSIRGMLKFFVFITVVYIILAVLNFLLTI